MLRRTIGLLTLLTSFVACNKFLEVETPPTALVTEKVFRDSVTATSAMAGIYERMMESQLNAFNSSGVLLLACLLMSCWLQVPMYITVSSIFIACLLIIG